MKLAGGCGTAGAGAQNEESDREGRQKRRKVRRTEGIIPGQNNRAPMQPPP